MGINHRKIVSFEYTKKCIIKYFNLKEDTLKCHFKGYTFTIEFDYNNYKINIMVQTDRTRVYYLRNTIKKIANDYHYDETHFCELNAYYDNKDDNSMPTKKNVHYQIKTLKKYVDENKIFYNYLSIDYKKRYFHIDNKIIDMPIIWSDDDIKYKFGDQTDRMRKKLGCNKYNGIYIKD